MFSMATITIATVLAVKANSTKPTSDIVLANIEALANNEINYAEYECFGNGDVICPITQRRVAYYLQFQKLN